MYSNEIYTTSHFITLTSSAIGKALSSSIVICLASSKFFSRLAASST